MPQAQLKIPAELLPQQGSQRWPPWCQLINSFQETIRQTRRLCAPVSYDQLWCEGNDPLAITGPSQVIFSIYLWEEHERTRRGWWEPEFSMPVWGPLGPNFLLHSTPDLQSEATGFLVWASKIPNCQLVITQCLKERDRILKRHYLTGAGDCHVPSLAQPAQIHL
jgi:hypothetical protein